MDKGYMKGRLRIAVALMVAVAAIVALPAMAQAATTASQYPAPSATLHAAPAAVSVDVFGAVVDAKTAKITVAGTQYPADVANTANGGAWTSSETLVGNVYKTVWAWTAGAAGAKSTLTVYPSGLVAGSVSVAVSAKDTAGNAITDGWSFTLAANGTPVVVPPASAATNNCTDCHTNVGAPATMPAAFAVDYSTDQAMGPKCLECHVEGFTPKHATIASYFNSSNVPASVHGNIDFTKSNACTACHGSVLFSVASKVGSTYVVPNTGGTLEHNGCSCHTYGEVDENKSCVDCHTGSYGATHGWAPNAGLFNGEAAHTASGHNTPSYGTVGAHEKWDGSEGVVVKDSNNATITQEWPLPTASVFWSQSKALNADGSVNNSGVYSLNPTDSPAVAMANRGGSNMDQAINKTVGWDSVVTCEDCHSALSSNEAVGPHGGATFANAGLDPNFPDDWTKAEITSFDPTGMRSIATTIGSSNPYYTKLGGNVYMPAAITSGGVEVADQGAAIVGLSIETTTQKVYGTPNGSIEPTIAGYSSTATKTVKPGGFYGLTNIPSTGYSAGTVTGRFICQKCHKLTNSFQGLSIEGNGRGFRDNNLNYMGMSNEAHMEHHNDMVTGQGNCVSCHIAIPHGWKRPRLLVYESDPAPYKTQYFFSGWQNLTQAKAVNQDISAGNWGFLGWNGTGSAPSATYVATSTTNAFTGVAASTHLEKLSASGTAEKELEVGTVPEEFPQYDAANGTSWGKWLMSAEGVAWPGDEVSPAAKINLSAWDVNTNSAVTVVNGDSPIQNNCTACTSAAAGTHAPQNGTNTGGEGINNTVPYWK